MKYTLFFLIMVFISAGQMMAADRILSSVVVPCGDIEYTEGLGFDVKMSRGEIRFEPDKDMVRDESTFRIDLPENRNFRLYSDLSMYINSPENGLSLTINLYGSYPRYAKAVKSTIKLKKGRHRYSFYLHWFGWKTHFRHLEFVVHHKNNEDETLDVVQPLTISDLQFNSVSYSIKKLKEYFADYSNRVLTGLPSGLDDKAVAAAKKKFKTQGEVIKNNLDILSNKSSPPAENEKALSVLYDLRSHGNWEVQNAAFEKQSKNGVLYGWTGGADKILRNGPFPGDIGGTAGVSLARNESEGVQIALYANKDIGNISYRLSSFKSSDGKMLSAENIKSYVVGYIEPDACAYFSKYIGYEMPDPLLDYLKTFDLKAKRFQAVWIDFTAPESQAPGIYYGKVNFFSLGKVITSVPVEVKVHKFALPDKPSFSTVISNGVFFNKVYEKDGVAKEDFNKYMFAEVKGNLSNLSKKAQRLVKIANNAQQMMYDHKVGFNDIYRASRNTVPAWRRKEILKYNKMFCLGYDNSGLDCLDKVYEEMRREGTANQAYLYGYDEIRAHDKPAFAGMKRNFLELKKRFPGFKTMATALDYTLGEKTNTTDALDIWVLPSGSVSGKKDVARRAKERGSQLWWYPCNWPYPPHANYLIENTATGSRMLTGVMPWKYDVDGVLYYSSYNWSVYEKLNTLIRSWSKLGSVREIVLGEYGYDGTFSLSTDRETNYSRIERWLKVPENISQPIIASFEFKPVRFAVDGGKNSAKAELRLNYKDGTTDRKIIDFDVLKKQWKKYRFSMPIKKPLKNLLYRFSIRNSNGEILIRNAVVKQENANPEEIRVGAKKVFRGGPVFGKDYSYSMFRSNGDGSLAYPGKDGLFPSMRLKFIRDGLEDYDYLQILKNKVSSIESGKLKIDNKQTWLRDARVLLVIPEELCRNESSYSSKGKDLLLYREKIATLIEQATR